MKDERPESVKTIEIGYIESERVIKIYFRFIYGFTNRRPHLSCRVSAFAKFKITAVQIFPAAQSMYVMCTVNMLTQYQIEGVL